MKKVINYVYKNKNEFMNSEYFLSNIEKYHILIDLIDLSELEKISSKFSILDYLLIYRQNKIKLLLANISNDEFINCANRFNFIKSESFVKMLLDQSDDELLEKYNINCANRFNFVRKESFVKMILEQSDVGLLEKYKEHLEPDLYHYYLFKVLVNDDESSFECLLWFINNFNNINISTKMKDITDAYENNYYYNIQVIKLYWYLKGMGLKNA